MGLIPKRKPVLDLHSHWCKLIESFSFSPEEFYDRVIRALLRREIPKLRDERIAIHEGGLLSARRMYLRLWRERLVIDICGAPFGTGFFVSWRLLEKPLRVNWVAVFVLALACMGVAWFALPWCVRLLSDWPAFRRIYFRNFGLTMYATWLVLLSSPLWIFVFARPMLRYLLKDIDGGILSWPIVGPLYERFMRPLTYHRIDITLMFQQAVHQAVTEVVDEITKAHGLPVLSTEQRKPILCDAYRS